MERFFPRISPLKRPSTSRDVTVSTVSPSDTEPTPSKRNRVYKYSLQWENQRPWLSFDGKRMFCSYCVKHSKSSSSSNNRFVVGCESLRLDNIRAHEMSMLHKNNHTTDINLLKPPAEQPIIKAAMNLEKHDIELMKNLFITAFYIAKHEKPFTDFVTLNELKERIYGSGTGCQHYNSDKQAKTFVNYIARSERDILLQNINNSEVIAVAIDGATDSANLEQELFYVTYLDENFQPRETYLKIVNVKGRATAEGLCECFFETFEALGIDVRSKCVQLATDGPSVMKNLCVRVRSKISWLLQFHCINHSYLTSDEEKLKHHLSLIDHEVHAHPEKYPGMKDMVEKLDKEKIELEAKEFEAKDYKLPAQKPHIKPSFYLTSDEEKLKHHLSLIDHEVHAHPEKYPGMKDMVEKLDKEKIELEAKEFEAKDYKLPAQKPHIKPSL